MARLEQTQRMADRRLTVIPREPKTVHVDAGGGEGRAGEAAEAPGAEAVSAAVPLLADTGAAAEASLSTGKRIFCLSLGRKA